MPQPRSSTVPRRASCARSAGPGAARRSRRVDCSRPAGVKYMRSASSPNFARARTRRRTWVRARRRPGSGGVARAEPGRGGQQRRLTHIGGRRPRRAVPGPPGVSRPANAGDVHPKTVAAGSATAAAAGPRWPNRQTGHRMVFERARRRVDGSRPRHTLHDWHSHLESANMRRGRSDTRDGRPPMVASLHRWPSVSRGSNRRGGQIVTTATKVAIKPLEDRIVVQAERG